MKERITITFHSPRPSWRLLAENTLFFSAVGLAVLTGLGIIYGIPLLFVLVLRLFGVNVP